MALEGLKLSLSGIITNCKFFWELIMFIIIVQALFHPGSGYCPYRRGVFQA